jgi:diguanylate cyclase (GGDEF)-like protein
VRDDGHSDQASQDRLATAAERDKLAHARDVAALARDLAGTARDRAMTRFRAASEHAYRAQAAEHLALAAEDREAGARDREQAARDRLQSHADRELLAREIRSAGRNDVDRELDRCRRTGLALVVAYVDVVGLSAPTDSAGHSSPDAQLARAVMLITAHLRSYDLVVRLGGDEFLCAMSDMTVVGARERFSRVAAALAAQRDGSAIRVGFAELGPADTSQELIERADAELIAGRSG